MSEHVGDDAELYALGALESHERDAVDAHLAACDACTRLVADAERTVDALASFAWDGTKTTPRRDGARPSVRWSLVAAVLAACFVLAAAFGVRERASLMAVEATDASIVRTLAMSHFAHTPFVANVAGAPVAKVLYARDGSWLYVIVDAPVAWHLTGEAHGEMVALGSLSPRGSSSILYVMPRSRVDTLTLAGADGTVVSHVRLAYGASP